MGGGVGGVEGRLLEQRVLFTSQQAQQQDGISCLFEARFSSGQR